MGWRGLQIVGPEGSTKLAYGFVSGVYGCAGTGNTDEVNILTFSCFALSALHRRTSLQTMSAASTDRIRAQCFTNNLLV